MKRKLFPACVFVLIVACLFFSFCMYKEELSEEYYYGINSLIRDLDFSTARVEDSSIVLFDSDNQQIGEIAFESRQRNIKTINIRKVDSIIYFIINGAIDDETGIMFINDDSNEMLDGIQSIQRIGGNSYQYSTSK